MRFFDQDRHAMRARGVMALIMSAGVFALPAPVQAQSWTFEPLFRVGAEYDDNAQLDIRTDSEVQLDGWLAEVAAGVVYSSDRTTFEATPRILVRRYADNPEFDSDDIFFRSLYRREGVKNVLRFDTFFDQQQVRTAERSDADFDTEDPTEITDDSSGRVALIGERSKWRFMPRWEYRISADSYFGADFDYFDVNYDSELGVQLRNYTDARLNLNYGRVLSEKTSMLYTGSVRKFDRDDPLSSEIDGFGVMMGFNRELSPQTQLRVMLGYESSDQGNLGKQNEPVADISLRHRLETIRLMAVYRRVINASGNGTLSARNSIMLNATRRLSEKISASVGLRAYQSENLSDLIREDRENVQLRSRFTWNITRIVSLSLDYRYSVLDRGGIIEESANSNQINLWFAYEPNPRDR